MVNRHLGPSCNESSEVSFRFGEALVSIHSYFFNQYRFSFGSNCSIATVVSPFAVSRAAFKRFVIIFFISTNIYGLLVFHPNVTVDQLNNEGHISRNKTREKQSR